MPPICSRAAVRLAAAGLLLAAVGATTRPSDPLAARAAFHTKLVRPGVKPTPPLPPAPAGSGVERVTYPTPLGPMAAYATPVRHDGKRRPALVWVEGGFGGASPYEVDPQAGGDAKNDQTVRTFLDAGGNGDKLVVLCPGLRGVNGDPGRFEMFLGEVDDVAAALKSVAARPDVDPNRVYLAGHSTGGTVALLAAAVSDVPAGVVSFGGAPDLVQTIRRQPYGEEPFDTGDLREIEVRSPMTYAEQIKVPVLYVEGETSPYNSAAMRMARLVPDGKMSAVEAVGQTHFSDLHPTNALLAQNLIDGKGLPTAEQVAALFPAPAEANSQVKQLMRALGAPASVAAYKQSPLTLTPAAAECVRKSAARPPALPQAALWVRLEAAGGRVTLVPEVLESAPAQTVETTSNGVRVAVDESSAGGFVGRTLDADAAGNFVLR